MENKRKENGERENETENKNHSFGQEEIREGKKKTHHSFLA